ncbi:hypothetical protein F5880DRAFT_709090 [Lentinula raphanica]|nr:hypothetical protein F5880DRAFT_709090 [Lentinula raphanica]
MVISSYSSALIVFRNRNIEERGFPSAKGREKRFQSRCTIVLSRKYTPLTRDRPKFWQVVHEREESCGLICTYGKALSYIFQFFPPCTPSQTWSEVRTVGVGLFPVAVSLVLTLRLRRQASSVNEISRMAIRKDPRGSSDLHCFHSFYPSCYAKITPQVRHLHQFHSIPGCFHPFKLRFAQHGQFSVRLTLNIQYLPIISPRWPLDKYMRGFWLCLWVLQSLYGYLLTIILQLKCSPRV